jgi:hypothetical protein
VVEMTFPTPLITRDEIVASVPYAVTWKGNTVVRLTPLGEGYPTYRHDAWQQESVPPEPWRYGIQSGPIHW